MAVDSIRATGHGTVSLPAMSSVSRQAGIWLVGIFFIVAGAIHFVSPASYLAMMPPWLPLPGLLVAVSGVAEIAGGLGVLIGRFRRRAAWGLILLLVAVFPANVHVALHGWPGTGFPPWVLWLRLPFQGVFVWLIYAICLGTGKREAESSGAETFGQQD